MHKNMMPYVYDFIRILLGKTSGEERDIILFGSVARGDFDSESDVDIFVNVPENRAKAFQKIVESAQNEFEIYSRRTWKLKGVSMPIKCVVGDINSRKWAALKREIISSGIGLYGKYKELPQKLNRYFIFSFNLSNLKSKNRVSVIRKIYGYSLKKGRKTYKQTGFLDETGGEKLNPSVIIIPAESYKKVFDFFRKSRVSFRVREVWAD